MADVTVKNAYEIGTEIIRQSGIINEVCQDNSPENLSRKENIEELVNGMNDFCAMRQEEGNTNVSLIDFLSEVSLLTDQDSDKEGDGEKVTLMTCLLYTSRNDDANTTSFKLAPEIGYNLSEQWALGVELQFNHEYKEHISTNTFAIAPYARFSYYENKIVRLFVDGGFGFATTKVKDGGDAVNGFEIGLKPGIAIKLNQHFSLVAKMCIRDRN